MTTNQTKETYGTVQLIVEIQLTGVTAGKMSKEQFCTAITEAFDNSELKIKAGSAVDITDISMDLTDSEVVDYGSISFDL